ncbi:hypothetical protein AB1286_02510 [Trinickia sp. NRRL B-1857]|uniref:hypothetical protein n=1 Tax=Trinickia sp. NRRL B-1857 TaxID=3162879 RepID=UPI003D290AAC
MKTGMAALLAACELMSGCCLLCTPNKEQVSPIGAQLNGWSAYQSTLANWLNTDIGRPNNMRVAAVKIAFPIGTVLRGDDSNTEISNTCLYNHADLPLPDLGPIIPSFTANRAVRISADPGDLLTHAIPQLQALNISLSTGPSLRADISDISTQILSESATMSILKNPACLTAVDGAKVSIIRGYISAKYTVSNTDGMKFGADAKVMNTDLASITYDGTGSFSVTDAQAEPKFYILSDGKINSKYILAGGSVLESVSLAGAAVNPSNLAGACAAVKSIVLDHPTTTDSSASIGMFGSLEECKNYIQSCATSPSAMKKCIASSLTSQ